jgi:KUP system potassium uptake protein
VNQTSPAEVEKPKEDAGRGNAAERKPTLPMLALTAVGVVFGDIATSPLYALAQTFDRQGVRPSPGNVLGLLSLVFWALLLVVTGKYVFIVMRADNDGEGGMMALSALARGAMRKRSRLRWLVIMVGLAGASLFFGDSVITPAISVLSAVEGLRLASPAFTRWVLPLGAVILAALFALQKRGSGLVGTLFGPVMSLWLLTLAALGVYGLASHPQVLAAASPHYAILYLLHKGFRGFASLGAVVLAVTGAEALYADIGHFGTRPIRVAWFSLALPALVLNYFGQGALLLQDASASSHPLFSLVPRALLYPLIALATIATVIASQAVISGTFSMVRQGIQLGYLPRARIEHTSGKLEGQIYMPAANFLLFIAVMAAVLGFRSSRNLAGAYGIAVSGTMLLTSVLLLVVARRKWKWGAPRLIAFGTVFLLIDGAFFAANSLKFTDGGWFPLSLAALMLLLMTVWRRGRRSLQSRLQAQGERLGDFVEQLASDPPTRVEGTAVFLAGDGKWVPQALLHNLRHNHVLHQRNLILTVRGLDLPRARRGGRTRIKDLGHDFWRVVLSFGFAERIDVPAALRELGIDPAVEPGKLTYFVGREKVEADDGSWPTRWRRRLFAYFARNAMPATTYFGIPPERLIEIGARVEL